MIRKALGLVMVLLGIFSASAQVPQLTPRASPSDLKAGV